MQHWDRIERCPIHLNHIPWLKILKKGVFFNGELFLNFDISFCMGDLQWGKKANF